MSATGNGKRLASMICWHRAASPLQAAPRETDTALNGTSERHRAAMRDLAEQRKRAAERFRRSDGEAVPHRP